MKSNKTIKNLIIVALSFIAFYLLFQNFKTIKVELDSITHQGIISYIATYFLIGIPIFIGTWIINKNRNILKYLGLSESMFTGIWTSALFTLPMFAGGLIFFNLSNEIEVQDLIAGTLIAGFMEELYYRGFLFGQLFKNTRLGFIPSIFLGALIFASGHLYQSQDLNELVGIFSVTFMGAVLFAWLFAEWNYNLWVPIFTHTFMNLSWMLFDSGTTALGGITANVFRALTIAIAILFTINYKKRHNLPFEINRKTLLLKRNNDQKN
ncbi:MAG: CPBP family intramembrane metalloprotease [Bacteroidetes bacterium]|nr:CPBP family intramembrane metalloprotease [Bacteroidota bacterium]